MNKIQVDPGQLSFDPLHWADSGYSMEEAIKLAQSARNSLKRSILNDWGDRYDVHAWRLTGQLRKYRSFGVPDGRVRTVYYLTIRERQ